MCFWLNRHFSHDATQLVLCILTCVRIMKVEY